MITVNGQEWHAGIAPGCSAPNGHYVSAAVVDLALSAGWQDDEACDAAAQYSAHYWQSNWQYFDVWHDITSDACDYLNTVTIGGYWAWSDGDFRLVETADCPQCGESVDADTSTDCPDHPAWGDM